jgi:O-antigen ligase
MRVFKTTSTCHSLPWQNLGAFLFFSLTFVLPSGYSYGALLLLVGSAISFRRADLYQLSSSAYLLLFAFLAYSLVWGIDGVFRGEGIRELDRPLRFLLAALVFVPLRLRAPSLKSIVAGIGLGGLSSGFIACHDVFIDGLTRSQGFMPVNSFGMIAALYAGFCFLVLQEYRALGLNAGLRLLLSVGAFSAVAAVFLSGSRGAYLVLLLIAITIVYRGLKRHGLGAARVAIVSASICFFLGVFVAVNSPFKDRVVMAYASTVAYITAGERIGTAIPLRLDMWVTGFELFLEKPIVGWGEAGYKVALDSRVGRESLVAEVSNRHLHNQFVHVLVTKGLIGLSLLGLLFYAPLSVWRRLSKGEAAFADFFSSEPSSVAGGLIFMTVCAYIIGGLARTPFEHHSGVMVFSFSVVIFLSLAQRISRDKAIARHDEHPELTRPV